MNRTVLGDSVGCLLFLCRQLDKKPMLYSILECPSQSLSEFQIDIHIPYNHIIKIVKKNTPNKKEELV